MIMANLDFWFWVNKGVLTLDESDDAVHFNADDTGHWLWSTLSCWHCQCPNHHYLLSPPIAAAIPDETITTSKSKKQIFVLILKQQNVNIKK